VTPHIPVLDRKRQTNGKYDLGHFQYDAERDIYTCLEGHELKRRNADENTRVKRCRSSAKSVGPVRSAMLAQMLRCEPSHAIWMKKHAKPYEISGTPQLTR